MEILFFNVNTNNVIFLKAMQVSWHYLGNFGNNNGLVLHTEDNSKNF